MAEAVDRLELVPDVEDVLRGAGARRVRLGGEQVDQLALEGVRVLELVDHDRAETELLGLADPAVVHQQVAREQLQVLEVERRLALLPRRVLGGEQVEQLLQQILVARRRDLERGLLDALPRVLEARRPRAARAQRLQVGQELGQRREVESGPRRGQLRLGRRRVVDQAARRLAQVLERSGELRRLPELERQRPPRGAQRLVDAGQHRPQASRAVGREQSEPLGIARGDESGERPVEGLAADHRAVLVVCLGEARIDADRERMGSQEPRTEAVDGRDPRPVELPREVGTTAFEQRRADPGPQLGRRLAGVGDHEHRLDVEPLVADGADEPLDQHRRLAGAGAGGDEHLASRPPTAARCPSFITCAPPGTSSTGRTTSGTRRREGRVRRRRAGSGRQPPSPGRGPSPPDPRTPRPRGSRPA